MHYLVIHALGVTFLIGRWIHAQGLLKDNLHYRVRGMSLTLYILIALSVANILQAVLHIVKS
jgi:uncharacterized protein